MTAKKVRWGDLGCPTETGAYQFDGEAISVKIIHIAVAENDPVALFTIRAYGLPWCRPEYMLGHRVA
jgi:hypothetical protein